MKIKLKHFCGLCFCILFLNIAQVQIVNAAAIGMIVQKQFDEGEILIEKIILEEPHIIPKGALKIFFAAYEGQEIGVKDIKKIQRRLSKYYYAEGYINSGVIVPNQRIIDNTIRLRAVHGRLTRLKLAGNSRVSNAYIQNAVARGVSVPLNTQKLQAVLKELQEHPLIAELNAEISPGKKLGQSILLLTIKEAKPYFFDAQVNNHQSPSVGQYRLGLSFGHRDLTGMRDVLKLDMATSINKNTQVGLMNGRIDYTVPITFNDYLFNLYADYAEYSIIDDEFSAADIQSKSTNFGFSQSAPLLKNMRWDVSIGMGLDIKHMTLSMFGEPATLSDGFIDGKSTSSPAVFYLNAFYQQANFVTAIHAGLRRGVNIKLFDSRNDDRQFTAGVGQLSMALKLSRGLEWHIRSSAQFTRDKLLPAEKYAIGGIRSVRGYRENLLVRDSGVVISTQFRYALYRSVLHFVPFADYGRSWNSDQGKTGSQGEQIYSIGAGLQWRAGKHLYSELFWGKTLVDIALDSKQSQDRSLHFLIRYSLF